jgi:hypothetical protein
VYNDANDIAALIDGVAQIAQKPQTAQKPQIDQKPQIAREEAPR